MKERSERSVRGSFLFISALGISSLLFLHFASVKLQCKREFNWNKERKSYIVVLFLFIQLQCSKTKRELNEQRRNNTPFISLFSLSLQLQMKSVNWSEKRKEMNGMMNEVKWRKSGKWSARAFLYFPLFILLLILFLCPFHAFTSFFRYIIKGQSKELGLEDRYWKCFICAFVLFHFIVM